MRLLDTTEAELVLPFFDEAAQTAARSLCLRAHCGAVIVKDGVVISRGFNSPPRNNPDLRTCLNEYDIPAGFRHDRTCCIHAEQRAIHDALKNEKSDELLGARMYFIRLDEQGNKIKATDLVCTICSRAVLDVGISEFALYADEGIRMYDAVEFNQLSYQYKTTQLSI